MARILSMFGRKAAPAEPQEGALAGAELAAQRAAAPDFAIERVHFFPLGGITQTVEFTGRLGAAGPAARAATA